MPTTFDSTSRPGYMFNKIEQKWYPIAGLVATDYNYTWLGTNSYSNTVNFLDNVVAKSKFNCFLNPTARTAAIPSPQVGLITFIQQSDIGATLNLFQYWNGSAWTNISDPDNVTLTATQTLTNKTLTSPSLTGTVSVTGRLDIEDIRETVNDSTIVANILTADYSTGTIFYVGTAPSANFTLNLTNMPTDNGKAISIVCLVTQGATGYIPNVIQVAGSAQTIKWLAGATPTPTSSAGKLDIFNFTLIRRATVWTVLGNAALNF
jgi:hypothetical protein